MLRMSVVFILLKVLFRRKVKILRLMGLLSLLYLLVFICADWHESDDLCAIPSCPELTESKAEFVIIICQSEQQEDNQEENFKRQIRQINVLLKSAASLTSQNLTFSIVSDSLQTYHQIINITQSWPKTFRNRIIFSDYKEIFYPPGTENMRNMFRPCATERLFLPQVYEEKDAVIFLDTDVLFLKPPENLWCNFNSFDQENIVGVAPCMYLYGPRWKKFPTYGRSGLNAGVLLMNLTRLRNFEGGWTDEVLKVVEEYGDKLYLADQDILNIIFSKESGKKVYKLGCEWNYRSKLCSQGRNKCRAADKVGIGLLHGAALAFVNGKEQKIQTVFEAWESHQIGESLADFAEALEITLRHQRRTRGCGRLHGTNNMLMKGLLNTLKSWECNRQNETQTQ